MSTLRREALIFSTLLGFGVLVLPFAVYAVGVRIIGEYEPDATFLSLPVDLWSALATGEWAAWLLVLSPYAVVQTLRGSLRLWRGRRAVTPVTESHPRARNWRV